MKRQQPPVLPRTLLALVASACCGAAAGAPATPVVVHGQASFAQQGNVFSITNTPGAVINWQGFSIEAGEITRFIQQSSDSAVLNRIVGQDPSRILGSLQSNGHVFLINPNGILFGRDSRVDVQGLTASTLALSDADFLAGRQRYSAAAGAGAVGNQGRIQTGSGGKVALIGTSVDNGGIISSPQGQVVLAAGHTVQLADASNPALQVAVSAPQHQAVNLGQLIAKGGSIGMYGALVRQRGAVNADSARLGEGGKIVLRASGDALLEAGSTTSATGAGRGGTITVEGERIGVTGDARIDASGARGGGTVLLGGGSQGRDPALAHASQTLLGKQATIRADATERGNGGTVVLWSDRSTRALGTISARGGAAAGNGGLVETSGRYLDVKGVTVQAGAKRGRAGTWLLDPYDIEVVASGGLQSRSDVDDFEDPVTFAQIDASTLSTAAAGSNVVLQATHDVTFSSAINPVLGNGSLNVDAGNNINVNAPISTGGGALTLTANHPLHPSGSGAVVIGAAGSIDTGGGNLTMTGADVLTYGPIATGGGSIFARGNGKVNFERGLATGGGDLTVEGGDIVFGGDGKEANVGTGSMKFDDRGTFVLGPTWTLKSGNNIRIFSDNMSLQGMIGPSLSDRPNVAFSPVNKTTDIWIANAGTGVLVLDPARLAAFDVAELFIGSGDLSGNITLFNEYSNGLANTLTLNTTGNITITKPVTMGSNIDSKIRLYVAPTNPSSGIATAADIGGTQASPGGRLSADNVFLSANNMALGASVTGTGVDGGRVSLSTATPDTSIVLGGGAQDAPGLLALSDTELARIATSHLEIGGANMTAGLSVTPSGLDLSTSLKPGSNVHLGAGGDIALNGRLTVPGTLYLEGRALQTTAGSTVKADNLLLSATAGIGSDAQPFESAAGYLSASNLLANGTAPIHIANAGALNLGSVQQEGTGNQGAIKVVNKGAMTLLEKDPMSQLLVAVNSGGSGSIALSTLGPLTLFGVLRSQDGNIALEAGNGGMLTVGKSGHVSSVNGSIALTAGDLINQGMVVTDHGDINLAATTVSGPGTYTAPGGTIRGLPSTPPITPPVTPPVTPPITPPAAPSVQVCLASPGTAGCSAVLQAALQACVANPAGPDCAVILPSVDQCVADASRPGCVAVVPPAQVAPGTPLALAIDANVQLLQQTQLAAIPGEDKEPVPLPAAQKKASDPKTQGEKREIPAKTYCN